MFISAPKKAAKPVSSPTMSPSPTASSPSVMSGANQLYAPLSSRDWMKARYQSNVMAGLPAPGGDRHGVLPVALERGSAIDPAGAAELVVAGLQPGEANEQADRQPEQAGRELPNRNRVKAGPSISMVSRPAPCAFGRARRGAPGTRPRSRP